MNKNTKIISAYPCCGKTYAKEYAKTLFKEDNYIPKIMDSDSSKFSWIEKEELLVLLFSILASTIKFFFYSTICFF